MDERELWWVGGAVALVTGLVAFGWWRDRVRSDRLADVALRRGLSFGGKGEGGSMPFAQLPLFQRGSRRRFRNVARGDDLYVFDYLYRTGSGRNRTQHRQTVAAVRVPGPALPAFRLSPEGWLDKLGTALGASDIDFPEDPAFSAAYRLRGSDENAVRALLGPGLRGQLTAEPGWSLEGEGEWIALYQRGKRASPDAFGALVDRARQLVGMIRDR